MDAFNFVKDIFEFAYYIVGVLGLITIYISVKNNIDVKKEKQELKNEKLELKKEKNFEIIRNFKITIYPEFNDWKKDKNFIISVDNINVYLKNKKLDDSYIKKIKDLVTVNDKNKIKYFINALYKVSKIYIKNRTESKDPTLDQYILDMYQGCIYECDLLDVFENYKEIALLFKEINKDLTNE